MFAIVDLDRLVCPLMLMDDLEEAEAVAHEMRMRHGRRIAVRRYPSSEPADPPEVGAEVPKAS
jgi:hypothetical protein